MLSHRDIYEDRLFLPLDLQFQVSSPLSLKLSGLQGELANLGDTAEVPLGLGVVANLTHNLDLGRRFSFDNLLGHVSTAGSRTASRSLGLLVIFRS